MQKQKQKQKKLNMSDLDSSGKFPMFFCLFVLNIHLGIFISVLYLLRCFRAFDFPSPDKQEEIKGNMIHTRRFWY